MIKKKKTKNKKSVKKVQASKKVSSKFSLVKKKKLSKKKTITSKKKKSLKLRKTTVKKKLVKKIKNLKKEIKKITPVIIKKTIKKTRVKKVINFDIYIQEIVTKLIDKHKIDGIYTLKIIEKAVPKRFRIPENVNKIRSILKSSNVTIVTEAEANELIKIAKEEKKKSEDDTENQEKKQTGKTDDPVRLYLRDMGAVELLSREGEIAIAKRIEAGRDKMIGAICESPMTIRSIINWKDSIKEGTMLLRDIVDLEATYDMTDIGDNKLDDTLKLIEGIAETKEKSQEEKKENIKNTNSEEETSSPDEDEDEGLNVSLAAMEEKLKPKVLKDFDEITKLFKKLQKHNKVLINTDKKNASNYSSLEKKYKKIQKEMVVAMKEVHFNTSTIEALMESLY